MLEKVYNLMVVLYHYSHLFYSKEITVLLRNVAMLNHFFGVQKS